MSVSSSTATWRRCDAPPPSSRRSALFDGLTTAQLDELLAVGHGGRLRARASSCGTRASPPTTGGSCSRAASTWSGTSAARTSWSPAWTPPGAGPAGSAPGTSGGVYLATGRAAHRRPGAAGAGRARCGRWRSPGSRSACTSSTGSSTPCATSSRRRPPARGPGHAGHPGGRPGPRAQQPGRRRGPRRRRARGGQRGPALVAARLALAGISAEQYTALDALRREIPVARRPGGRPGARRPRGRAPGTGSSDRDVDARLGARPRPGGRRRRRAGASGSLDARRGRGARARRWTGWPEHAHGQRAAGRGQGVHPADLRAGGGGQVLLADGPGLAAAHRRHRGPREHPGDARPQAARAGSRSCATTRTTCPRSRRTPAS